MTAEKHSFDCVCEDCLTRGSRLRFVKGSLLALVTFFSLYLLVNWWYFRPNPTKSRKTAKPVLVNNSARINSP